jgi:hypothetical protein
MNVAAVETREEQRARERRERNERVPFDWRIAKVDQRRYCDEAWLAEAEIETCGVYYLYDANRHVHICSFTPSQELWPVASFATFASEQAAEADEGDAEQEMLSSEEPCCYMDVSDVSRLPSQPAGNLAPEREPGEDCEAYYTRAVEEMTEHLRGNPPCW